MVQSIVEKKWYVVDASGKVLGRLATRVASILRGKHKPEFAPHKDVGDHIIVINAGGIVLTGNKIKQKELLQKVFKETGVSIVEDLPAGIMEQLESMNDYETLWQDVNRFLSDLYFGNMAHATMGSTHSGGIYL